MTSTSMKGFCAKLHSQDFTREERTFFWTKLWFFSYCTFYLNSHCLCSFAKFNFILQLPYIHSRISRTAYKSKWTFKARYLVFTCVIYNSTLNCPAYKLNWKNNVQNLFKISRHILEYIRSSSFTNLFNVSCLVFLK